MNRSLICFVPTLTYLEHREGPAALAPGSMLFQADFFSADNVLIPDGSNGTTATIHSVTGVQSGLANVTDPILTHLPNISNKPALTAVASTHTTVHGSQPLDQPDNLSQVTQGISVASPGLVIPSGTSKPSNSIVELPTHTQGHVYAPPHRQPPVRVPVI